MPQNSDGYVTKFAPHQALKLTACGKLTFDERVVLHRVFFPFQVTLNLGRNNQFSMQGTQVHLVVMRQHAARLSLSLTRAHNPGESSSSVLLSSLELSDTQVCEPSIRARLGTAAHFCEVAVLKLTLVSERET